MLIAPAEVLTGAGHRFSTFGYIFFAMGLGGAVVIDKQVFPGAYGNAGEYAGIWPADVQDERPTMEQLRKRMALHGVEYPDIQAMITGFDVNAPGVEAWIERALPRLNQMVSAIAAVIDPETIVLGGRIPKALAECLVERMTIFTVPRRESVKPSPRIVVGAVTGDAAAAGAAAIPLKARFFR